VRPSCLTFCARIALAGCIAAVLSAQPAAPPPRPAAVAQIKDLQIPKISHPPTIDEFLNGSARTDMKRVDDFRQRNPGDGVPISQKTAAYIGYDRKNLYVVFVCSSAPGQLRARLSKREDVFSDDVVGVVLDTFHDHQRGYEFFANPLGVQAEATESESSDDDFSFETLWFSAGRATQNGFVSAITLPFRSLRFSPSEMQTWGIAFFRSIPATNENAFWPFISNKVAGFSQQMGNLSGLEGISPGRNMQFIPYAAFAGSHYLDASGVPAYRSKTDTRAGMDVKAVLHDSLTLDMALNPDFSQVESDDPQVTVNQRYEVVFPEKRPFFLENSGYFGTPQNLFFSRRIEDPEFGARLTGRLGRWSLGALGIDDRAPGRTSDAADPNRGKRAAIGVFRLQRDFGKQSNIGILVTDREFAGSFNRVAAMDARVKLSAHWTASAQAMTSHTNKLGGGGSGGSAYYAGAWFNNRNYSYSLNYVDFSNGFHTDLGYIQRTGIRRLNQFAQRNFRPHNKTILRVSPGLSMSATFDRRNVQQNWSMQPQVNMELVRSTYFSLSREEAFERYGGINFRGGNTSIGAHTEYFKKVTFDSGFSKGARINYDPAGNLAPFLCNGSDLQMQVTVRPTFRMKVDTTYYLTRLRARRDSFAGVPHATDGRPAAVFVNHLARTRVNYQFTRELSLRLILDYNGVIENPSLVNLERQKRITGDALLTYLLHPGTALYVGYTDRIENQRIFPGAPPRLGRTDFPSATTGRGFFVKLSYLYRL
jgi:hypothetical protein